MRTRSRRFVPALLLAAFAWASACRAAGPADPALVPPPASPGPAEALGPADAADPSNAVVRTGYVVQVGAFSVPANAARLTTALNSAGLDAFAFPSGEGLFRVRFGDFPTRESAASEAARARKAGLIDDYFIVRPEDHPIARPGLSGGALRDKLVATAASLIGTGYAWGGTTSREGFDCSGLVRAVYQLNGLSLPRSAAEQYRAGTAVPEGRLSKGDLVFFSGPTGEPLSHVGLYTGDGTFIHAPGTGKTVREDSLGSAYFKARYSGAKAYLR